MEVRKPLAVFAGIGLGAALLMFCGDMLLYFTHGSWEHFRMAESWPEDFWGRWGLSSTA